MEDRERSLHSAAARMRNPNLELPGEKQLETTSRNSKNWRASFRLARAKKSWVRT